MSVTTAVVEREGTLFALREHGGPLPFLIEAAPVHAHHDAKRFFQASVRHGFLAVEADTV